MTTETIEVVVAHLDELPIGEGRAFAVGSEQIAVFRLRSGVLRAVQAVCPHAGGPLADGQVDESVVICPLHLNTWALATGLSTSGQPPVTTYPVTVDTEGRVLVTVT